jgi:plastocyanin
MFLLACGGDDPKAVDAGASGDAPTGPALINGCQLSAAVDLTAAGAARTVTFGDDEVYRSRCIKIAVGQSVTWSGSFSDHPLMEGVVSGTPTGNQAGNPIPHLTSGTTVTVAFPTAGTYAYYCTAHAPGMSGVVYVQ